MQTVFRDHVAGTGSVVIGAAANAIISASEVVPAVGSSAHLRLRREGQQGTVGSFNGTNGLSGIPIISGKITTCTIHNNKMPAKLTVTKIVTNDNGVRRGQQFHIEGCNTTVTFRCSDRFCGGRLPHQRDRRTFGLRWVHWWRIVLPTDRSTWSLVRRIFAHHER
jgi:hypothetical protein